jgi:outer membrane protein assembly factor BamB
MPPSSAPIITSTSAIWHRVSTRLTVPQGSLSGSASWIISLSRASRAPLSCTTASLRPDRSQAENAGANPQYPCCTFRGNVTALRAKDGSVVWKSYTLPEPKPTGKSKTGVQFYGPSGTTIWSLPTIDDKRKLFYMMTGNGYSGPDIKTADAIVAMDMATGAIRQSRQASPDMFNWDCGRSGGNGGNCPENGGEDVDFGSSAILVTVSGRDLLIAGQKSGIVHAFDPDRNGEIVWQTRIGKGGKLGGILWETPNTMASSTLRSPIRRVAPPTRVVACSRSMPPRARSSGKRLLRKPPVKTEARVYSRPDRARNRHTERRLFGFHGRPYASLRHEIRGHSLGF